MNNDISIENEEIELIIDGEKYYKMEKYYFKRNNFLKPIFEKIVDNSEKIKSKLYVCPSFIELVKNTIPSEEYNLIFSNSDKIKLANGSLKLMTSSNGDLLANLVNPKTGKIVSNIKLEKVNLPSEINSALINYGNQVQLAKIAEDIRYVQLAVEEVREGQENDRLAIAYSCKQKLLQAMEIDNKELKRIALLNVVSSAEDSRNQLMLSQQSNVRFLRNYPKESFGKYFKGEDSKKDERISELRENMNALNLVSLAETLAYQELGEYKAANTSLKYYGDFINETYLSDKSFLERLDSLNPSTKKYWSTVLPSIKSINKRIQLLNSENTNMLKEDVINEEK